MKLAYAAFAVAFLASSAFASVPDGCTKVDANWVTAPTYSCAVSDASHQEDVRVKHRCHRNDK